MDTFFFQPVLPIRVEVEIKLEGSCCNLLILMQLSWLSIRKRNLVLQERTHTQEKLKPADKKDITYRCKVLTPEMTVTMYDIDGLLVDFVSI